MIIIIRSFVQMWSAESFWFNNIFTSLFFLTLHGIYIRNKCPPLFKIAAKRGYRPEYVELEGVVTGGEEGGAVVQHHHRLVTRIHHTRGHHQRVTL